MSKGPLAVRWGATPAPAPQAGVVETLGVELSNGGTVPWNNQVKLAYHWLERGVVEKAHERFALPVTHVVVDLNADRS